MSLMNHMMQTSHPQFHGRSLPKQRLPDIWQTLASSGVSLSVDQLIPLSVVAYESKEANHVLQKQLMPTEKMACPKKRQKFKRTLFSDVQKRILIDWLHSHKSNPYPTLLEKQELMQETGLNREQINIWFTNNRIRHGLTGIHANSVVKGGHVLNVSDDAKLSNSAF